MPWDILLLAVVLSVDSFSAAFAMGFRRFSAARALSFALSSAFAEGAATALGFLLGRIAKDLITSYDHWVAFVLLVAVGTVIGHLCNGGFSAGTDVPIIMGALMSGTTIASRASRSAAVWTSSATATRTGTSTATRT